VPSLSYAEHKLEWVENFKYLEIDLHQTKGFTHAAASLLQSGRKATFSLQRKLGITAELGITDVVVACRHFDTIVMPILSYGCACHEGSLDLPALVTIHTKFTTLGSIVL
jgi:hypothetical protein